MAPTSVDVAIVGGGLVGCFSAYFLRRRGRSVAVLEKGKACRAASFLNFGNLRLQGRDPREFPISLRAQAVWEDLSRLAGDDGSIARCGHVYLGLAAQDGAKLERTAQEARAAGLDVELMDGAAARRRWPALSDKILAASWSRRDAIVDPTRASPAVVRLAQTAGARFLELTQVTAIEAAGSGFLVRTATRGSVFCAHVVNAAGAWAGEIARQLGEPVPMFAAGPPLFTLTPQHTYTGPSLHAVDGTFLLRSGDDGDAVAGSLPRVKADPATGEAIVPPDRLARGLARLAEVLPGLGRVRAGRVWSGVEGYLPDLLPVIGWSGTTPGPLHAFGFSGHGFQMAPGVGAAVAELIADGTSKTPTDAFSIARFSNGVAPDPKLWSEFDPELVATLRQAPQGSP